MSSTGWDLEYKENRETYQQIFDEVMSTPKHETDISFLEKSLSEKVHRKEAVVCASGTDALLISLKAMGVGPGDGVLVSSFSWLSSASVVSMVGATPVFCDIDLNTYHMCFESMAQKIRSSPVKVKAIIYPQLFGNMTQFADVEDFCWDNGIGQECIIEDACQALGAWIGGTPAGCGGNASAISFNANKNVAGIAGGGAVLTDSIKLAAYARKWRQHGNGEFLGTNSKMLLLNAAIINHRLKNLDDMIERRQKLAKIYDKGLADLPVYLQTNGKGKKHTYHKYVVRFEDKKTRDLAKEAIGGTVHYTTPINYLPMYENSYEEMPNARHLCDTILTLPLHHYSEEQDLERVLQKIWDAI